MAKSPNPVSPQRDANVDQQAMQKLKQSAGYIIGAIAIALAGYFGWVYLQSANVDPDTVAAEKYASIEQSNESIQLAQDPSVPLDAETTKQLNKDIDALVAEHGSTVYAWQALMLKARNATDSNDMDVAIAALKQALSIDLDDPGLHAITQLRYATVLLGNGNIEEAMKQASTDVPLSFEASQQELLGDIYMAKNQKDDAVRSYENAWSMLVKRQEERPTLRLKIESLGITPEPIEQPPSIVNQAELPNVSDAANTNVDATESEIN